MVVVLDLAWGLLQENKHLLVHRPEASLPIQTNTYALSYMLSHTKLSAAGSILHLLRVPNNLYVRVPAPNEHPVKRYNAVNEVTIVRNVQSGSRYTVEQDKRMFKGVTIQALMT